MHRYADVYAPNSPINLSGGSHFYGALVGSTINNSGGTAIHYDSRLPFVGAGSNIQDSVTVHVDPSGGRPNNIMGEEDLNPLGLEMAKALVAALGGDTKIVEGYGKGAIVGQAGELEHGALWHVPGGYAMRALADSR